MKYLTILLILLLAPVALANDTRLLNAIQAVETGGEKDPAHAVGDSGKALGWMQIHRSYYLDAKEKDKTLPSYKATAESHNYSRQCVKAYWRRYKVIGDYKKAMWHHYGNTEASKKNFTDKHNYWAKVQKEMKP